MINRSLRGLAALLLTVLLAAPLASCGGETAPASGETAPSSADGGSEVQTSADALPEASE